MVLCWMPSESSSLVHLGSMPLLNVHGHSYFQRLDERLVYIIGSILKDGLRLFCRRSPVNTLVTIPAAAALPVLLPAFNDKVAHRHQT